MEISWRDDFAVGVPAIDDQHKELFSRFNQLLQACNEGRGKERIGELIAFLKDYTIVHFFDEEALQQEIGYPEYLEHHRQHTEFVARLDKLSTDFSSGGASLTLVLKTNNMLLEWLISHISRTDRKIGEYIRTKPRTESFYNSSLED